MFVCSMLVCLYACMLSGNVYLIGECMWRRIPALIKKEQFYCDCCCSVAGAGAVASVSVSAGGTSFTVVVSLNLCCTFLVSAARLLLLPNHSLYSVCVLCISKCVCVCSFVSTAKAPDLFKLNFACTKIFYYIYSVFIFN